jgi:hypothetical protein
MKPNFNATFLATVAAVIPLLFIALAVQGDLVTRLMIGSVRAIKRAKREQLDLRTGQSFLGLGWSFFLYMCALLIVVLGTIGEIKALFALEYQKATSGDQAWVMAAALVLVIGVVLATLLRLGEAVFPLQNDGQRRFIGRINESLNEIDETDSGPPEPLGHK